MRCSTYSPLVLSSFCVWSPDVGVCNEVIPDILKKSGPILIFTLCFLTGKKKERKTSGTPDQLTRRCCWIGLALLAEPVKARVDPSTGSYRTHFVDWSRPPRYWCWSCWGSCCPLRPEGGAGGSQTPARWRRSHTSWNTTTRISEAGRQRESNSISDAHMGLFLSLILLLKNIISSGPTFYSFSHVYFSFWTPVKHEHMITYARKTLWSSSKQCI